MLNNVFIWKYFQKYFYFFTLKNSFSNKYCTYSIFTEFVCHK